MKQSILPLPCTLILFLTAVVNVNGAPDYATPYAFSTLAGISSIGSQDGTGADARFFSPRAAAMDAAGNAYIVDTGNHLIRKITPAGAVSTLAGKAGEPGSTDGTGAAARFASPQDIVAGAAGEYYVTDTGNHTIRKVTAAGVVTTLAGLAGVSGSMDGPGAEARFNVPLGIAIDTAGNLFVTESGNGAIRKITPAGVVSTYASNLGIREPYHWAIAVDGTGAVFISQYMFRDYQNYYINGVLQGPDIERDIGFLTQVVPNGAPKYLLQTSTTVWPPELVTDPWEIMDIIAESTGNLILARARQLTRFSPSTGTTTVIAGSGTPGSVDGPAGSARFSNLITATPDPTGGFIVADYGNNTVRKVDPAGAVTTLAGLALEKAAVFADGTGAAARFGSPAGVVADASGNVYVADYGAHCIRKITSAGVVTTLAGKANTPGSSDGTGDAARFNGPTCLTMAPSGYLYVTDSLNNTVRSVSLAGDVTTVAGTPPGADGTSSSVFSLPHGIAVNATGNVFVADTNHHAIRMIARDGSVQTFAGVAGESGLADGSGSIARFRSPYGLTIGAGGTLYVTEGFGTTDAARIRKVTSSGDVTTVAGAEPGYTDGAGNTARFHDPVAITVGLDGSLFVVDASNQAIRKITASGAVSTVAGLFDAPGNVDGVGRDARFFYPQGIAMDLDGHLYVSSGTSVRKGLLASVPMIATQPASQSVQTGASVNFSVTASALPSPTYQWNFNGTVIGGATVSTFSLTNVRASDAGDYTVVVTNAVGSTTSSKASLTVTAAPVPPAPPSPAPSSGGGGGGAIEPWFLLVLSLLGVLRAWRGRRSSP
jgi:sugar lactone lactonase YvrE